MPSGSPDAVRPGGAEALSRGTYGGDLTMRGPAATNGQGGEEVLGGSAGTPISAGRTAALAGTDIRVLVNLLDQARIAGAAFDPDRRVTVWTAGMEALFGYTAEQALGADALDLATLPGEREHAEDLAAKILAGEDWEGDFRVRTRDGERLGYFRTRPVADHDGALLGAVSVGVDAQAVHRAAQEAGLLDTLFSSAPLGLGVFDRELRFVRVNRALETLLATPSALVAGRRLDEVFPEIPTVVPASMRRVLVTGEPVQDVEVQARFLPGADGEKVCRASFYALRDQTGEPVWVGCVVVDVTEQRRAQAARDAATRRLALLSEASRLVGTSLDLSASLDGLVKLVVPALADHCVLDLVDVDDGAAEPAGGGAAPGRRPLRRSVTMHRRGAEPTSPSAFIQPGTLVGYPAGHPVWQALASRRGLLWREIDPAKLDLAPSPAGAAFARDVGVRSALFVPLIDSGEVLGVASFVTSVSGRRYDADDLTLAEELAARAATAVANARAYHRERAAALTLQRSLLPHAISPPDGLEVAWRYEPGGTGAMVGGDWFDVIPLGAGRVALTVGDVMGRGVAAAAVMGQLRAAIRGFAALDLLPADVLAHLDLVVRDLPEAQMATCLYAVYDPADGTVELAAAGHVPPVLCDGLGAHRVAVDPAVPLGVGGARFSSTRLALPAGSVLALYTDGLIETRGADLDQGIARLERALGSMPHELKAAADAICTAQRPAESCEDDIALLLVRPTGDPADTVHVELPIGPRAAGAARRVTAEALRRWSLGGLTDTATLLVSELATNALRYGGPPIHLLVRRGERVLYVQVADSDAHAPRIHDAAPTEERGRGLQLVDHLATRWGTRPTPEGKTVWFELSW